MKRVRTHYFSQLVSNSKNRASAILFFVMVMVVVMVVRTRSIDGTFRTDVTLYNRLEIDGERFLDIVWEYSGLRRNNRTLESHFLLHSQPECGWLSIITIIIQGTTLLSWF